MPKSASYAISVSDRTLRYCARANERARKQHSRRTSMTSITSFQRELPIRVVESIGLSTGSSDPNYRPKKMKLADKRVLVARTLLSRLYRMPCETHVAHYGALVEGTQASRPQLSSAVSGLRRRKSSQRYEQEPTIKLLCALCLLERPTELVRSQVCTLPPSLDLHTSRMDPFLRASPRPLPVQIQCGRPQRRFCS
jgi:hypothetical protein